MDFVTKAQTEIVKKVLEELFATREELKKLKEDLEELKEQSKARTREYLLDEFLDDCQFLSYHELFDKWVK